MYLVQDFQDSIFIRKGCNPSFVALISNIYDPKFVKDYNPISLIGCQYNIIDKLLSNRLSKFISNIVNVDK